MGDRFCVYKHTSPNGKVYIGITCQKPAYRWSKGNGYKNNVYFYRAIQKYGWESFQHEILFTGLSKEDARKKEVELIKKYNATDSKCGYNNSLGGGGFNGIKLSQEQKDHLSKIKKGINPHIWTDEMKQKQSQSHKGRKAWNKGKKATNEHRNAISRGLKGHKGCEYNKIHYSKGVVQYDLKGNEINRFYSQKEAVRKTGVDYTSIHLCCEGKRKTAKGYIWKYSSEVEQWENH